jgi:alkylation response protein AidB-like acyl-CoA dehydrogenase
MAGFGWLAMTLPPNTTDWDSRLAKPACWPKRWAPGRWPIRTWRRSSRRPSLIATGASPAQQARWLPDIASGAICWWCRPTSSAVRPTVRRPAHPGDRAARAGADGQKSVVPCGDAVPTPGWSVRASDDAGASPCFVVPRGTAGVHVQAFESVDGAGACALRFDDAVAARRSRLAERRRCRRCARAFDRAAIAACAESVGAMQAMLKATVEYTRTRQQFGKPLAANQVLRHRMADMSVPATRPVR